MEEQVQQVATILLTGLAKLPRRQSNLIKYPHTSPDQSAKVSEALKEASRESVSLESLVDGWAHLVQDIEEGYGFSIYDYTNVLSVRDILDSVIGRLPKDLAVEIENCLKEWDDRFLDSTRSVQLPIVPTLAKGKGWRWFRVPKKLLGELREDLLSEGIIDPSGG